MGIRKSIARWLMRKELDDARQANTTCMPPPYGIGVNAIFPEDGSNALSQTMQYRFTVAKIANGRIIELSTWNPNAKLGHNSTLAHEVHIVHDGERISEVIERLLAIKKLEG